MIDTTIPEVPTAADPLEQWVRVVEAEFRESPGLRLTRQQVQRFWGFDRHTCNRVLARLESRRFLKRTPNDAYARADVW